jgi:hypothetical protein
MSKKETITVQGTEVTMFAKEKEDYISLTDIAKYRDSENPSQIISLWPCTYSTIEYLGLWETLNNPNFNPHIYEGFKNESAKPHFWMLPQKWINETNALLIRRGLRQSERLVQLNSVAITQMKSLLDNQNPAKRLNRK